MRIEFEDQGQDVLHFDVDDETGLITDCQPFHTDLYANGDRWIELESAVEGDLIFVYYNRDDMIAKKGNFLRWPIAKVTRGDANG